MGWLVEAETMMPDIFKAGTTGSDGKVMDELYHFVLMKHGDDQKRGVPEQALINYARERVPAHSVLRVLEVMERSGMISAVAYNKTTGQRLFRALPREP